MRGRLICPLCAKSGHREQQPRQQKTPSVATPEVSRFENWQLKCGFS
jgi:hypothetical protein